MDRLKKSRTPIRQLITKKINNIKSLFLEETSDERQDLIKSNFNQLSLLMEEVHEIDKKIMDCLLDKEENDETILNERESIQQYNDNFAIIQVQVSNVLTNRRSDSPVPSEVHSDVDDGNGLSQNSKRRSFKLPKIELKKFNGSLKEWLGFWSQFQKIHEDDSLHNTDKFQYLIQAMEIDTEPREIVLSYPQTAENYPKALEALKERYGREDLLLQVYIRELLKLVISNVTKQDKLPLSTLLIKLESHLRSLSTLNLSSADPSTWLFPLVESSLPEETLRAWQRSQFFGQDANKDGAKTRLDRLMDFVKSEVQNDQQIRLAQSGFENTELKGKPDKRASSWRTETKPMRNKVNTPTVSSLSNSSSETCIFCGKMHDSRLCQRVPDLTVEERRSKAKERKCCYSCLRPNHLSRNCKANIRCFVCSKKHLAVMCPELVPKEKKESEQVQSTSNMANNTSIRQVVLQTLMVTLVGRDKEKTVRAFLDCGSQRSYLLKRTAKELELKPFAEEVVTHALFGGSQTPEIIHNKYKIRVKKPKGKLSYEIEVRDQLTICQSIPQISGSPNLLRDLKSKKIWISDFGNDCPEIELLIGMDVYAKILTSNIIPLSTGLSAIETKLGWTLGGERTDACPEVNLTNSTISMFYEDKSLTELWNLETIGIQDPIEVQSAKEHNREVQENFLSTLKRNEDGRYAVALPWKQGYPEIPSNREIAEKRLERTTQKLGKMKLFQNYAQIFEDWKKEGFIEELPYEEVKKECHYLPHRPVVKPDNLTTPVRPVFDASCKTELGISLNDCLEKGPNYIHLIPEILLRFRENIIGVVADIRKAFQMIEMQPHDREYFRFLWWEDYDNRKMKIYRHTRVVFGATCSPFILGAVLDYHLSKACEEDVSIISKLKNSLYVDNCVTSVNSVKEYEDFQRKCTTTLLEAKMELRNWETTITNLPVNEEHVEIGTDTKVLGLNWNRKLDTLSVDIKAKFPTLPEVLTKRLLLSIIQKVFDVIGFLAPALLPFKLLFQKTWHKESMDKNKVKAKAKWDIPLPEIIADELRKRYNDIYSLREIEIPRLLTNGELNRNCWSLHTFTDASSQAYAAAVFLRVESHCGTFVQLMLAKARLAPLKAVTIPRLELLGCLLGSRLACLVRTSLALENVREYFWTDSSSALAWIKRNEKWATFVGNRVQEIRKSTNPQDWRHIPGVYNPADLVSRGCYPSELKNSRWWEGPTWLELPKKKWPFNHIEETVDEEIVMSEKRKTADKSITMIAFEMKKNYSYSQIVRIVAWMLRFCNNAKRSLVLNNSKSLSFRELKIAEIKLLKSVQMESFSPEGDNLKGMKIIRDENDLIRVKTKLVMRDEVTDFKYPYVLPREHKIVTALIKEEHELQCHAGVQFLMTHLRRKFWIIQSRRAIRSVISKCIRCKRYKLKNAESEPAPLPNDRVKDASIFEIVGIDLAGPLILKDGSKTWIVLFTCAVYRAIHLELVTSLSTGSFLLSLRRFIARRGRPSIIYCDNGKNFVGASNALKNPEIRKLQNKSELQGIEWKFNPPTASWWGGWWERLIRSVKDLLKRMLGKAVLTYEELLTSLCDVEAVINGRPLTYVSEDPDDLIPLTPALFLKEIEDVRVVDLDQLETKNFQSRFRYRQRLIQDLKRRFRKEYLSQLVQRTKKKTSPVLKKGDLVLLGSENFKKQEWPLARIVDLIPGRDGVVRVAKIKTKGGILVRPIQRLYPLEIEADAELSKKKKLKIVHLKNC